MVISGQRLSPSRGAHNGRKRSMDHQQWPHVRRAYLPFQKRLCPCLERAFLEAALNSSIWRMREMFRITKSKEKAEDEAASYAEVR